MQSAQRRSRPRWKRVSSSTSSISAGSTTSASTPPSVYGGPLSYVLENAGTALGELLRVTKPGGHVLVSVMSLLGAARAFFSTLPQLIEEFGWERAVDEIFEKRDLAADVNKGHVCRLYRWSDLQRLVEPLPCRIVGGLGVELPLRPERELG